LCGAPVEAVAFRTREEVVIGDSYILWKEVLEHFLTVHSFFGWVYASSTERFNSLPMMGGCSEMLHEALCFMDLAVFHSCVIVCNHMGVGIFVYGTTDACKGCEALIYIVFVPVAERLIAHFFVVSSQNGDIGNIDVLWAIA
jgi:hypothetical protein